MTIDGEREKTTQNMAPSRWRRSSEAWPENAHTAEGDWTLIDAEGEQLARIYNMGRDDGVEDGDWRWRVFRPGGLSIGGSAESGTDAKKICEGVLKEGCPRC